MDANCESCPVAAGLACYRIPTFCERASRPGENVFRGILARHAETRAAAPPQPAPLSPEEYDRLRAAETCPHRDCVGCGCKGCRCKEGGRRSGDVVNIADCLACVGITSPSAP